MGYELANLGLKKNPRLCFLNLKLRMISITGEMNKQTFWVICTPCVDNLTINAAVKEGMLFVLKA